MTGITSGMLAAMLGFALLGAVQSSNILFALSLSSLSHMNIMNPIMAGLLEKGFNVTLLSPLPSSLNPPGVNVIHMDTILTSIVSYNEENNYFTLSKKSHLETVAHFGSLLRMAAQATFTDPALKSLVNSGVRFDLVVIDAVFNDHLLALPYILKAPFVLLSACQLLSFTAWNLNVPLPPSVYPAVSSIYPSTMSFTQRLGNSLTTAALLIHRYFDVPYMHAIVEKEFPGMPPLLEIERNASLVLVNSFPTLTGPKPSMPYVVEIGGIHCRPPKKLPNELAKIAEESGDNGFIYFSMGSVTAGNLMPPEFLKPLLEVFARLNQTIIMKYEGEIPNAPKNVKLVEWMPQQDVLGHKNCKVFITHGGLLSLQEAVYHAVPVLVFPLMGDQFLNAMIAHELGIGHFIIWHQMTVEETHTKLSQLINDPKFKANAEKVAKLFKDRPMDPVDYSVYWLDYVIRTGGAKHLKSKAFEMSFFQYFLLDILIMFIIISIVFSTFVFLFTRAIARFIFDSVRNKSRKAHLPNDKKAN